MLWDLQSETGQKHWAQSISKRCLWFLPSMSRKSFTSGASQAQTTRHFFILRAFVAPLPIFAPRPSAEEQSQEEAGEVSEELHGELHTPKLPHPATHILPFLLHRRESPGLDLCSSFDSLGFQFALGEGAGESPNLSFHGRKPQVSKETQPPVQPRGSELPCSPCSHTGGLV